MDKLTRRTPVISSFSQSLTSVATWSLRLRPVCSLPPAVPAVVPLDSQRLANASLDPNYAFNQATTRQ